MVGQVDLPWRQQPGEVGPGPSERRLCTLTDTDEPALAFLGSTDRPPAIREEVARLQRLENVHIVIEV